MYRDSSKVSCATKSGPQDKSRDRRSIIGHGLGYGDLYDNIERERSSSVEATSYGMGAGPQEKLGWHGKGTWLLLCRTDKNRTKEPER